MKKFVKLSLAAAVASTGFVSANAGALEDAIKNTSIVGYATLRYDDRNMDNNTGSNEYTQNNHKSAVVLTSKINDNMSYTYAAAILSSSNTSTNGQTTAQSSGIETYNDGSIYTVYNYMTYTGFANTTINFGTQTIDTVFTNSVDTAGGTQEGNGITASTTIGGISLFAGYYNENNISSGDQMSKASAPGFNDAQINNSNLMVLKANTKLSGVALDASYVNLEDIADGYSFGASTKVESEGITFGPFARYTQLDIDGQQGTNKLWAVGSTAKMGIFGAKVTYASTGKNGGFVAVDTDAVAAFQGWGTQVNGTADADNLQIGVSAQVLPTVGLSLQHNKIDAAVAASDVNETYGQVTWKPSKNFLGYVRYGEVDYDGANDGQRGRINLTYLF